MWCSIPLSRPPPSLRDPPRSAEPPEGSSSRGAPLAPIEEVDEDVAAARAMPSVDVAALELEALAAGRKTLPHSDKFPQPEPVACRGGCSHEVFCSAECEEVAWSRYHCLLCPGDRGLSGNPEALREFFLHADATNDIFHLAARAVAAVALRAAAEAEALRAAGGPAGEEGRAEALFKARARCLPLAVAEASPRRPTRGLARDH